MSVRTFASTNMILDAHTPKGACPYPDTYCTCLYSGTRSERCHEGFRAPAWRIRPLTSCDVTEDDHLLLQNKKIALTPIRYQVFHMFHQSGQDRVLWAQLNEG